jgi:hypothetical protein
MASDASALANTPRDSSMREEEGDRETNARRNDTSSRSARTKGTLAGTRSVFFFLAIFRKRNWQIKNWKKIGFSTKFC